MFDKEKHPWLAVLILSAIGLVTGLYSHITSSLSPVDKELKASYNQAIISAGYCSIHGTQDKFDLTCLRCVSWYGKAYGNITIKLPEQALNRKAEAAETQE